MRAPVRTEVVLLLLLIHHSFALHLHYNTSSIPNMATNNTGAINPESGTSGNPHASSAEFEHAPENAHSRLDRKDERSHANTLADAARTAAAQDRADAEPKLNERDPTAPARAHGNKPSRGAVVDKDLQDDDAEILRQKEQAKEQSKAAHSH
ncbi:hypothetical protein Q5752_000195 [Cryptotrichosporon argae]